VTLDSPHLHHTVGCSPCHSLPHTSPRTFGLTQKTSQCKLNILKTGARTVTILAEHRAGRGRTCKSARQHGQCMPLAHTVPCESLGQNSESKAIEFAATLSPGSNASRRASSHSYITFLTLDCINAFSALVSRLVQSTQISQILLTSQQLRPGRTAQVNVSQPRASAHDDSRPGRLTCYSIFNNTGTYHKQ
jgi:hypothetical protein